MEKKDYFGEIGCCIGCDESRKQVIEENGHLLRDTWYKGKYYSCLCSECKCVACEFYSQIERNCQRQARRLDNIAET